MILEAINDGTIKMPFEINYFISRNNLSISKCFVELDNYCSQFICVTTDYVPDNFEFILACRDVIRNLIVLDYLFDKGYTLSSDLTWYKEEFV